MMYKHGVPKLPISNKMRANLQMSEQWFAHDGSLQICSIKKARKLAQHYGTMLGTAPLSAAELYGAGHIYLAWHLLLEYYARAGRSYETHVLEAPNIAKPMASTLIEFSKNFPDAAVWNGQETPKERYKKAKKPTFRRWTLTQIAQANPAFFPLANLFQNPDEHDSRKCQELWSLVKQADAKMQNRPPENTSPLNTIWKSIQVAPYSVKDQLIYTLMRWGAILGDWTAAVPGILDLIEEESRPHFHGPGLPQPPDYSFIDGVAQFSQDDNWMPSVVLLAKNTLVWLKQLSRQYQRPIHHLDEIPNEELDVLASRGFNALWLIGFWKRSHASQEIKQRMGNPEAAASAYSIFNYDIAEEVGGWEALINLRDRAAERGIRLSSDMTPNHVGIDSDWVRNHPERLLSLSESPFPGYTFNSANLSGDASVDIRLEDHYWDKSDAAVVFQRRDTHTGALSYIYHGNDGTSMPWNDTAQINFLNPEVREAVMQDILHVARNFPIIRFDAAMVLARKHIRRLWFPVPGEGGAIPSRSERSMPEHEFNQAIPCEFWREVVDRVAQEVPGTLLLAEAFWMMEGYFVRSLGMHRVYNSAFMNMLRDQKNTEYREIIKETLLFDPGILQRFVNFMNNPDEETAVAQYGKDDRYFAICTLLITLPGLPMLGHGQVEGFSEKYGMEYTQAYWDEEPDMELIARHEREIFPLMRRRSLFAEAASFRIYDVQNGHDTIDSVYAYTNCLKSMQSLIIVNNAFERAQGTIFHAAPITQKDGGRLNAQLASALVSQEVSDDAWLLMRDHVASLWFIRSVGTLRAEGLHIDIQGFGRQVFLEFRIVTGSAWAALAAERNGRGIDNPDMAVAEVLLRPVKTALENLICPELITTMACCMRRGRIPQWPEDTESVVGAIEILRSSGAGLPANPQAVLNAVQKKLQHATWLYRFRGLVHRRFLQRISQNSEDAQFLVVWSILSVVALDFPPTWGRDIWPASMPQHMETVLSFPDWKTREHQPGEVLAQLISTEEVRRLCGVNSWNGVLWYTLEGWNSFVHVFGLWASMSFPKRRLVRRIIRRWLRAHRKSAYHLDALILHASRRVGNRKLD